MSDEKPNIMTTLHVVDENDPKMRRQRRKAEAQRNKQIDGWNRVKTKQMIHPKNVTVLSKAGLHANGARIYVCPKCNGKKQIQRVLTPQAGWKLPAGITTRVVVAECHVCRGKGHIWI